jgi:hypothetical protein
MVATMLSPEVVPRKNRVCAQSQMSIQSALNPDVA